MFQESGEESVPRDGMFTSYRFTWVVLWTYAQNILVLQSTSFPHQNKIMNNKTEPHRNETQLCLGDRKDPVSGADAVLQAEAIASFGHILSHDGIPTFYWPT